MHWIAPSEKDTAAKTPEKRLWEAADQFRAKCGLKAREYAAPVLGLIFLRFAETRVDYLLNRPKAEDIGRKVNAALVAYVNRTMLRRMISITSNLN